MKPGQILVVGCSSSEIGSYKIGSHSSETIGQTVYKALYEELKPLGIYLAAQCCEHLNRSLILEEEAAEKYGYEPVNVVPQLKAGGSFSTAAYHTLEHPVAVEHIKAHAGIDIGDTLIGMHMRDVAVPVRIQTKAIGGAHVVVQGPVEIVAASEHVMMKSRCRESTIIQSKHLEFRCAASRMWLLVI